MAATVLLLLLRLLYLPLLLLLLLLVRGHMGLVLFLLVVVRDVNIITIRTVPVIYEPILGQRRRQQGWQCRRCGIVAAA